MSHYTKMAAYIMSETGRNWCCRGFVALGLVLALVLMLVIPQHMKENSDWSLQYAVQNFADGQFVLDRDTFYLQSGEAQASGASLDQYTQIDNQNYAYTEAPGYIFYLLPFHYVHAHALANVLLAAGAAAVVYLLLRRIRDERTACVGALLWIFSPVALAMLQRAYADTFAAAAFLGIGGGLYIYYCLRRGELSLMAAYGLLFLAGLGLGWSVFANYANTWAVGAFLAHFIYLQTKARLEGRKKEIVFSALCFCLGMLLPLAGLLMYQNAVFGAPLRFGFQYTGLPVGFSWQYIQANIRQTTVAWLIGYPLLIPGLAALVWALYHRTHKNVFGTDLLLLLAGWVAAVFGLYLMYELTASSDIAGMPFIVLARYALPGLMPLTLLSALWLEQLSQRALRGITAALLVWGVIFFAQSALAYPEVPINPLNPWRNITQSQQDSLLLDSARSIYVTSGGVIDA
ncbi:MAG: hypothetical protein FWE97_01660 [Dehalococcoidia bacterium]|nr:hypothetical protein [Dehalococcoidia bacterium]